jgi:hypothetical protein
MRQKYPHFEVPDRARRDFIDRMDNEGRFIPGRLQEDQIDNALGARLQSLKKQRYTIQMTPQEQK